MQLGIFAYTFVRPTVEQVFDAVRAHGMANTEWNYVAIKQQEVPDQVDPAFAERVRVAAAERGISVDSIAGYTNLVDPDPERRRAGLQRLCGLIRSARAHGAGTVALCTGSRDAREHVALGTTATTTPMRGPTCSPRSANASRPPRRPA